MHCDSSDDDLPDIPMVPTYSAEAAAPSRENQMRRLQDLEDQFRQLRQEMATTAAGSARVYPHGSRGPPGGAVGASSHEPATAPAPPSPYPNPSDAEAVATSGGDGSGNATDSSATLRDEAVHYELRRLVPHLSPGFHCDYRDAILLISAVRNGGSSGAGGGQESLTDRLNGLEAVRRSLDARLARKTDECDELRGELEQSRQRLRAVQQQAQQSMSLLSLRREEMRKQLLIEESRTEKIQIRNKKLEKENEELKARLRAQMR